MSVRLADRLGRRTPILLCVLLLAITTTSAAADARYEVTAVRYHIEGATQDWALANLLELEEGQTFASEAELAAFIEDRRRILNNQRTLQSSSIEYVTMPTADNTFAVEVDVRTQDTWNIIVVPYPTFDSNSGLTFKARARDYNFFGTLERFELDLDLIFPNSGSNALSIAPSFSLPFQAAGYDWSWLFDASATFEFSGNSRLEAETGLRLELPFLANTLGITYLQGIHFNSAPDDADGYFLSSDFALDTAIDTGLALPLSGSIEYRPTVGLRVNYRFAEISYERRGLSPYFEHSLVSEQIDWLDNLRHGFRASLTNRLSYNIARGRLFPTLAGELRGFLGTTTPFAFSGRVSGFYNLPLGGQSIELEAANRIRGVLNRRMSGDLGFYLNSDITLIVFTIPELVEAQGSIFFDIGYVRDTSTPYSPEEDTRLGVGIEGIAFPLFARSLLVRLSIGVDPVLVARTGDLFGEDNPEIFFGIGHHY